MNNAYVIVYLICAPQGQSSNPKYCHFFVDKFRFNYILWCWKTQCKQWLIRLVLSRGVTNLSEWITFTIASRDCARLPMNVGIRILMLTSTIPKCYRLSSVLSLRVISGKSLRQFKGLKRGQLRIRRRSPRSSTFGYKRAMDFYATFLMMADIERGSLTEVGIL
jgi:hypothetical protein